MSDSHALNVENLGKPVKLNYNYKSLCIEGALNRNRRGT